MALDLNQGALKKGLALSALVPIALQGIHMTQKHDLVHELPEFREEIHQLKTKNAHFARLFDEYHAADHELHRYESGAASASDEHLENLKKQRLHLKDELYAMLKKKASGTTCCGGCQG